LRSEILSYLLTFFPQPRPVFLCQQIVREGLKFISITKLAWGKLGQNVGNNFLIKNRLPKNQNAILDIFAWAVWCNFLRGDYTHRGASLKPLITKIGDRPVGPYTYLLLL
jgi:hypothetical protein